MTIHGLACPICGLRPEPDPSTGLYLHSIRPYHSPECARKEDAFNIDAFMLAVRWYIDHDMHESAGRHARILFRIGRRLLA